MNLLELTNEVGTLCSIQGSISDPASVVGIQSVIVKAVVNAWESLQTYRKDWDFMMRRSYFSTVIGQQAYTTAETTAPQGYDDIAYYMPKGIQDEGGAYLTEIPYSSIRLPYLLGPSRGAARYTIEPFDNLLILNDITETSTLSYLYTKTPQILRAGIDVPGIPVRWHKLIVFKALETMAVYMGNGELYQKYSMEYAQLLGELMRVAIPPKRVPLYGGIA